MPKSICFRLSYCHLSPMDIYLPAQTKGQATVPAPRAQVLYSLAPVWSAIIAQLTLGGESVGIFSWVGGSAILIASALASQEERKQPEN